MTVPRSSLSLALLVAALIAVGCGDSKSSDATQSETTTQAETATVPPAAQSQPSEGPRVVKVKPSAAEADLSRKPKPLQGRGKPPADLVAEDLIVGKGRRAAAGDTVSVQYVGVLFDNGKEFDASWNGTRPGQPLEFPLGTGQVIPGWDQGVVGMRVGGRRKLIIPADLAYGAQGTPGIPPNSALIFDIDLKKAG